MREDDGMRDQAMLLTPLPTSPARGEVLTVGVERFVFQQLDRNTSPLAGEAGRGVSPGRRHRGGR
ncbi:hypothetical protein GCM10011321_17940 [Youhaiella tibetensis]|nr:hypothetical protein XM25_04185 [Devosia sp. H5989]GGF26907.1 hypothetical protein GCM10011321_17940 [Youhaiella tibetensis]